MSGFITPDKVIKRGAGPESPTMAPGEQVLYESLGGSMVPAKIVGPSKSGSEKFVSIEYEPSPGRKVKYDNAPVSRISASPSTSPRNSPPRSPQRSPPSGGNGYAKKKANVPPLTMPTQDPAYPLGQYVPNPNKNTAVAPLLIPRGSPRGSYGGGSPLGSPRTQAEAQAASTVWGFLGVSGFIGPALWYLLWTFWMFFEGPQSTLNYDSWFGWVAALVAAINFSFTEVPAKIPSSQRAGPVLFNGYGYIGCGLLNLIPIALLWLTGHQFEFQVTGFWAALDLMIVQYFARQAVWELGIGVAPACWASTAAITSFAWGTLYFGDKPWNMGFACIGLAIIIAAACSISYAFSDSQKSDGALDLSSSSVSSLSRGDTQSFPPPGVMFAVIAGLCDGSMQAFFTHFQASSAQGRSFAGMMQYMGSFGIGILGLNAVILGLYFTIGPGKDKKLADLKIQQCGVPAVISGLSWAQANSCGLLAAHYLGMALAFPLTQTALVFGGIWSLYVFNELKTPKSSKIFAAAVIWTVIGALFLSVFGQTVNPMSTNNLV